MKPRNFGACSLIVIATLSSYVSPYSNNLLSVRAISPERRELGEIEEKFRQIYNVETERTKQYWERFQTAIEICERHSMGTREYAEAYFELEKKHLSLTEQIHTELQDLLHRPIAEIWRWGHPILVTVSWNIQLIRQEIEMLQKTSERRNFSSTKFQQTMDNIRAKRAKLLKRVNEKLEEVLNISPPPPRLISAMLENRISENAGRIEFWKKERDSVSQGIEAAKKYWKPALVGSVIFGTCTLAHDGLSAATARQQLLATKDANRIADKANQIQMARLIYDGGITPDGKWIQVP